MWCIACRKYLSVVMIALMGLALYACGGKKDGEKAKKVGAATGVEKEAADLVKQIGKIPAIAAKHKGDCKAMKRAIKKIVYPTRTFMKKNPESKQIKLITSALIASVTAAATTLKPCAKESRTLRGLLKRFNR